MLSFGRARLQRLGEEARAKLLISVDGCTAAAREGDTLLVAILTNRGSIRQSEFGDGDRAGFCLMGACQGCWLWLENGDRIRACSHVVENNLKVCTHPPETAYERS